MVQVGSFIPTCEKQQPEPSQKHSLVDGPFSGSASEKQALCPVSVVEC